MPNLVKPKDLIKVIEKLGFRETIVKTPMFLNFVGAFYYLAIKGLMFNYIP
ncbi:MAG: hypothetical protein NTY48_01160 [Candidatus Diapherotrites archaeon]|nr:hypothetical protein [Candidatus Diapherotrites archaeon]